MTHTTLTARARVLLLGLIVALLAGVLPAVSPTPAAQAASVVRWEHKGFSLPVWDENGLFNSGPSLEQLAKTGANSVTFVLTWYTPNPYSTDIYRTGATVSDASLVWAIRKARSLGLQVTIKPHVDPQDGQWRAYINPSNADVWWTNYGNLIKHYADIGRQEGASALVIGAEMISISTNRAYEGRWRSLIGELRGRFPGKLTYSANWGSGDFAEEFTRVPFWDALDYLGISAYFVLADNNTPTVASIKARWEEWKTTKILPFQQRVNKPVWFIEGGYRSADGAAREPFNAWDIWPYDAQEQVDLYEALFQTWADVPWFAGTALWAWNTNTNIPTTDIWYEVQNKPAQQTITTWFGGGSATPAPTATPVPTATPAPTPAPSAAALRITIRNPESNKSYGGAITVRAVVTGATSVTYRVNERAGVAMTYNSATGEWTAPLDTRTFANGEYYVTVTARNAAGATAEDRAWTVRFTNTTPAPTATPVPTATPAPTPAPSAAALRITIRNPESNKSYGGAITVRAVVTGATSVTYRVNERAGVAMTYNSATGEWTAPLDTRTFANGEYYVTVTARNAAGATAEDRAWTVRFTN